MTLATPVVRLDLTHDRWVQMHLASVNVQLEVLDLPMAAADLDEAKAIANKCLEWLRAGIVETSWGSDIGDGLTVDEMRPLISRWMNATEEVAVPFESESSSETPSAEQPSEEPTAVPRRSRSRRSSKS